MTRILYLLRHAKSSWNYPELNDFERPLNKRGRQDAPVMAGVLKKDGSVPDLILSSPATRAAMTARAFAELLRLDETRLKFDLRIYEATPSILLDLTSGVDDTVQKLMLVGHNPGLTDLANFLNTHHIENIPTAGICAIALEIDRWELLTENCGKFLFLKTPKEH